MQTLRAPTGDEMHRLYMMGYDAWGDGDTKAEHLLACETSEKYRAGEWFVWDLDGQPVASLLVLQQRYKLPPGSIGLAAVATDPDCRRRGYAYALIEAVINHFVEQQNTQAVFLHSDIDLNFYRRLGFEVAAPGSHCMVKKIATDFHFDQLPDYF
ncbi:GNAT family N-acetyltransferase [Saccharospirillum mangrovi]|uniref:GNAT family N-acetyltransferase n=1 Tax=Saccharospirillum mangrovi TaxID=2161747 RepID=UPI000D3DB77F|nr:GNAT family N-acetyltransferase [Saccharospirillum mangrovi]